MVLDSRKRAPADSGPVFLLVVYPLGNDNKALWTDFVVLKGQKQNLHSLGFALCPSPKGAIISVACVQVYVPFENPKHTAFEGLPLNGP